jgi:formylmethanofuran dehydrogenase subunit E
MRKVMVDDSDVSTENEHRPKKVRLVIHKSSGAFIEKRCQNCGKLLMKEVEKSQRDPGSIQILCHKCKHLNNI